MKRGLVLVLFVVLLFAGCSSNGKRTVAGGGDYETSYVRTLYSPDPNGGVGFKIVSDSLIPQETDKPSVAVGPTVNFSLGQVATTAADIIIPGSWNPLANAPAKLFGTMSLLYDIQQETFMFVPGTEIHFMPDWQIHPVLSVDYIWNEGGSITQDGTKVLFGAEYLFK